MIQTWSEMRLTYLSTLFWMYLIEMELLILSLLDFRLIRAAKGTLLCMNTQSGLTLERILSFLLEIPGNYMILIWLLWRAMKSSLNL